MGVIDTDFDLDDVDSFWRPVDWVPITSLWNGHLIEYSTSRLVKQPEMAVRRAVLLLDASGKFFYAAPEALGNEPKEDQPDPLRRGSSAAPLSQYIPTPSQNDTPVWVAPPIIQTKDPWPWSGLPRDTSFILPRSPPEYVPPPPAPSPPKNSCAIVLKGTQVGRCRIGGINGMSTSVSDAERRVCYVQEKASGHQVEWVYNHSNWVGDVGEIFALNYFGISPNTGELLKQNWIKFHEDNKDCLDAKYFQICHSQGALHVYNALKKSPPEIRNRIIVLAIAPARVVPNELCYESFNYASALDPVPKGILLNTGFFDSSETEMSDRASKAWDEYRELILLDPHTEASGIDHDFESKTFEEVIDYAVQKYLKLKGQCSKNFMQN